MDAVVEADQSVTAVALTDAEVAAIAQAASERWDATGLSAEQTTALSQVNYVIEDLQGDRLGSAEGNTIKIDIDAAGRGWFVDATPLDDSEYIFNGSTFGAVSGSAFAGVDLLTTILHEQGHILGLADLGDSQSNLMHEFLGLGERRLAADGQAVGATPGSLLGENFMTFGPVTETYEIGETAGATTFSEPGGPDLHAHRG